MELPSALLSTRYRRIATLVASLLIMCNGIVLAGVWTIVSPTNCQNFLSSYGDHSRRRSGERH